MKHNRAERYVFKLLREDGLKPKWAKQGKGFDIETKAKLIEVKGKNNFRCHSWLGFSSNFLKLGKNINKFWLYIVFGIDRKNKHKKILKIPADFVLKNLDKRVRVGLNGGAIRQLAKEKDIKLE